MTPSDIQLISAAAGLIGSALSALCTYGYEPFHTAEFCTGSEDIKVLKRNKLRKSGQALGLGLISLSFLIQIISVI
nr:hypothetical protein [Citrobacter freundii]